jgi:hypothetical protein
VFLFKEKEKKESRIKLINREERIKKKGGGGVMRFWHMHPVPKHVTIPRVKEPAEYGTILGLKNIKTLKIRKMRNAIGDIY